VKVTPISHGLDLLASDLERSPGIHASSIYGDLFKKLEPGRYGRYEDNESGELYRALGTAWEKHFEYLLSKSGVMAVRPGEFVSPGGWALSPDLLLFNGHDRIGEIKLTWMSSKGLPTSSTSCLPPKFDKYMVQIMDGCHAVETSHAILFICFVNGNYKPPKPELLAFDLEFTSRELRENFDMMSSHRRSMGL